jgi:expansin (peptidoglycan-binding protein)
MIFYRLALFAFAALVAVAAPIDVLQRHTSAPEIPESEQVMVSVESSIIVNGSGTTYSGRGTWFTDRTGSCGVPFTMNDMIVAMNQAQMDSNSQCGKTVRVSFNGKSITARVVDTCPSSYCSSGALDLSQAAFRKLAPLDKGVIAIRWQFV